jgi:hypothetical protein
MAKATFTSNPKVRQIQNDLELYLEFCADYGYKYDESTLYNMRSYVFQQYMKHAGGKSAKNIWLEDAKKFESQPV